MRQLLRSKVLLASVLATGLAAGVFAQGGPGGRRGPGGPGGFGGGRGVGLPLAQLELTDAQKTQLKDVMQRHRADLQAAMKQLGTAHDAQRKAIETTPLNEGLVRSTSDAVGAAQTELAVLQARIHSDVFALLTPEQQAKAKQLSAERETRMKEHLHQFQNRQQKRQQKPTA